MRRRGVDALEQLVDRVGHEDGNHADLAEIAAPDHFTHFHAVRGEVPRTTDEQLHALRLGQLAQFLRFRRGEGHGLFQEHVLPALQRGLGLRIVHVGRRGDDHGIESGQIEQRDRVGHRVRRAEISRDFIRLVLRARLHGEQFGPRMGLDRRNVGVGRPPTRTNHADLQGGSVCHARVS